MKIFRSVRSDGDQDSVDAGDELLEEMQIDSTMRTDEPHTKASQGENSANKSAAPEVHAS